MDFKVIFSETFCADLERIVKFIAAHDPTAATKFGDRVIDTCENLSFFPERNARVRSRPNIRRIVVLKNYKVFYRIVKEANIVEILRLWDARRGSNPRLS